MPNSGLGTSSQTFSALGDTAQKSQTNPYGPAVPDINHLLSGITNTYDMMGQDRLSNAEQQNFSKAQSNLNQLPNFGPQVANTARAFMGGDPTGLLRAESQDIGIGDPQNTPGMRNVLDTIKNDISNQVNGQFAGAGRSLSGLNTQTLARGLAQGEAVPLLNQYNQNIQNQMGIQGAVGANVGQGMGYAAAAPGFATQIPMAKQNLEQQRRLLPAQYAGAFENLLNPIAGLGGSSQGTQQNNQQGSGTATSSLLSQLGQAAGLINPFGGLLGTLFG